MNAFPYKLSRRRKYFLFSGLALLFSAFALRMFTDAGGGAAGANNTALTPFVGNLFHILLFCGIGLKGIFLILVIWEKGMRRILPGLALILAGLACVFVSRLFKETSPPAAIVFLIAAIALKLSGIFLLLRPPRRPPAA